MRSNSDTRRTPSRGGASNVGAEALSYAAGKLELASSTDHRDGTLDKLFAELARTADSFREAATQHFNSTDGGTG